METLQLSQLIILSEQSMPILCPPEMQLNADEFLQNLVQELETYRLPVVREMVNVCRRKNAEVQPQMLLSLRESKFHYLKVLVGMQKFGALAYVERRYLLMPPNLPPNMDHNSSELPPRLHINSRELPARNGAGSDYSIKTRNVAFINETHRDRMMAIEQRRVQRMELIIQRQKDRKQILETWFNEVHQVLDDLDNPVVVYLKDSVDLIIKSLISKMQEKGAKINQAEEHNRQEEELKKAAKELHARLQ